MHAPHTSIVRDYLDQGQRPHVNFHGVRYTNTLLASTALYLGKKLRLYYNSQDLRTVRAFAEDGAEIGVLKAQGAGRLGRDRARSQTAPGSGSAARAQAPRKRHEPRGPDAVHRGQAGKGQAQPARCQRIDPDPACAGRRADQRLTAGTSCATGRVPAFEPTIADRTGEATAAVHPVGLRRLPALNGAEP
jgi:hypothetical protein